MSDNRAIVEGFYAASAVRDREQIASLLADDVDWLVQGPVDVLPFFGQRRGKAAVLAGYREIAEALEIIGYEIEALLVDGDRAAAMIRITAMVRATGRVTSVRTTQFSRLAGGKLVEMRGILDSFDMAEQTLGRRLVEAPDAGLAPVPSERSLV